MATITIPAHKLEEMMEDTAKVVVTSFGWDKHMRNEPDVEFEVKVSTNYEFETDEVVLIEEYHDLENKLCVLQAQYDELMVECNAAHARIELGNHEYAILKATYNAVVAAATKPKWAFWKK